MLNIIIGFFTCYAWCWNIHKLWSKLHLYAHLFLFHRTHYNWSIIKLYIYTYIVSSIYDSYYDHPFKCITTDRRLATQKAYGIRHPQQKGSDFCRYQALTLLAFQNKASHSGQNRYRALIDWYSWSDIVRVLVHHRICNSSIV